MNVFSWIKMPWWSECKQLTKLISLFSLFCRGCTWILQQVCCFNLSPGERLFLKKLISGWMCIISLPCCSFFLSLSVLNYGEKLLLLCPALQVTLDCTHHPHPSPLCLSFFQALRSITLQYVSLSNFWCWGSWGGQSQLSWAALPFKWWGVLVSSLFYFFYTHPAMMQLYSMALAPML